MRYNPTMPNHRFVPTLALAGLVPLLAWAQSPAQTPPPAVPAATPEAVATEAELLLDAAIVKLKALQSVKADIHQEVDILDQKFAVDGEYLKAPDYQIRLRLAISGLAETKGEMEQICDGQVLWDYSNILDERYYSRLELKKVLDRLNSPEFDETVRAVFIQQQLGLAGPQALLEGLRQAATFEAKEEGEIEGKAVWILRGRWKDGESLGLGPMAPLPSYVPSLVYVWLGKEDGWPYQVILQGKAALDIGQKRKITLGPDGRPAGNVIRQDKQSPSRFLLKYTNVQLNPEIPEGAFAFRVPPGEEGRVIDSTEDRMAVLENASRVIIASKAEEAAKSGAEPPPPVLDEGISIPTPAPAPPTNPPGTVSPAPATSKPAAGGAPR
jgi:outer membrane lipoprotein-sorting protein